MLALFSSGVVKRKWEIDSTDSSTKPPAVKALTPFFGLVAKSFTARRKSCFFVATCSALSFSDSAASIGVPEMAEF